MGNTQKMRSCCWVRGARPTSGCADHVTPFTGGPDTGRAASPLGRVTWLEEGHKTVFYLETGTGHTGMLDWRGSSSVWQWHGTRLCVRHPWKCCWGVKWQVLASPRPALPQLCQLYFFSALSVSLRQLISYALCVDGLPWKGVSCDK